MRYAPIDLSKPIIHQVSSVFSSPFQSPVDGGKREDREDRGPLSAGSKPLDWRSSTGEASIFRGGVGSSWPHLSS